MEIIDLKVKYLLFYKDILFQTRTHFASDICGAKLHLKIDSTPDLQHIAPHNHQNIKSTFAAPAQSVQIGIEC